MKFFTKIYSVGLLLLVPICASADILSPSPLIGFKNPLSQDTICGALKLFLNALLTLGVPVATLFLVYAGFLFVWARGNPKGLEKAKRNLFWVVIGIGLFLGAWLLGQIIANTLSDLGNQTGNPNSQIGSCV